MEFETYETECLDLIDGKISDVSEMVRVEREFLNGIVRYYRPKKILEVGIAAGASSAVLLNAVQDFGGVVYSIDYSEKYYRDGTKKSGYIVDERVPEVASQWRLYTGGVAAKFMEEIGGGVDLCLIDTMHCNPGEFLDFLMVQPYLSKNAIVVLHDTALHTLVRHLDDCIGDTEIYDQSTTCGTLMSVLRGERISASRTPYDYFSNISAVVTDRDSNEDMWPYFNLLTLPWAKWDYLTDDEMNFIKVFFLKHYNDDMNLFFDKIMKYKSTRLSMCRSKNVKNIEEKNNKNFKFKSSVKVKSKKNIINFIKSYFLFPWYVYKIYDKLKSFR